MNRHTINLSLIALLAGVLFSFVAMSQPGSWVQTQGPSGGNITALAVTPAGTVLAGTEEGIHRSTDGGATWKWASATMTYRSVSALARDSSGAVFVGTGQGKIYRSTDDGVSWQDIPGTSSTSIIALCCKAPATLWLTRWNLGISRTTDNGAHWQALDSGLTDKFVLSLLVEDGGFALAGTMTGVFRTTSGGVVWAPNGLTGSSVYSLARHPGGNLFAATPVGIFRSTNNGDDWTKADNGAARSIVIDTSGLIITGMFSGEARRSTDGGTSWNSTPVSPTGVLTPVTLSPSGHLYAGSPGMGVYQSTDKGITWLPKRDGLAASIVSALLRAPDNSLYAGTDGSGLYRTTDGGTSWLFVPTTPGAYKVMSLALDDSGKILVGTWGYGLLRQSGTGGTWQTITYGYFYCVVTSPGGVILAANDVGKVLHSTDYGKTWSTDSVGNGPLLSVADGGDGYLYAGLFQQGLFRSSDNGKSWTAMNSGLSNPIVRGFLVRPGGVLFAGTDGGLFRTTDRGESWAPVTSGLFLVRSMLPIGANQIVGVGWRGVSFSSDGGASWGMVNAGLWPAEARSIAIDATGYLYAGTANAGVFKSSLTTSVDGHGESSVPAECSLRQNYPNPFNPTTGIRYSIAGSGGQGSGAIEVRLVVYDLFGREVAVLVDEKKAPGSYTVRFDGNGLASGVYFYRLQAEHFVETKKLLLMR